MSGQIIPFQVMSRLFLLAQVKSCALSSGHVLSGQIRLCPARSGHVLSHLFLSSQVLPFLVFPCRVWSCLCQVRASPFCLVLSIFLIAWQVRWCLFLFRLLRMGDVWSCSHVLPCGVMSCLVLSDQLLFWSGLGHALIRAWSYHDHVMVRSSQDRSCQV